MAKKNDIVKVTDIWTQSINPLHGLNSAQIERMLSDAHKGNDTKLQQCFELVEQSMPIFGICIEKRLSGIVSRKWKILPVNESDEAKSQAEAIQKIFEKSDTEIKDNLTEAIRHLGMSAFKGRAIVKPFMHDDGTLIWKKIDNWHVLESNSTLYWNPEAQTTIDFEQMAKIPLDEVCMTWNSRPIDYPGISIYLRQLVGETKWSQFVERQGIPQVILNAPDGTPDDQLEAWTNKAYAILNGGSGVLPYGSNVTELTQARSQDPFSAFCKHQMEMIAILATGGSLSTIGGATGMGSNLADVQESQFQSLISQDCKKIANAINACAMKRIAAFLKQKLLCRFEFIEDEDTTADEYLAYAKQLKDLGIAIDLKKLKELTKLEFMSIDAATDAEAWTPEKSEVEQ